jgi:glutathione peroxidase
MTIAQRIKKLAYPLIMKLAGKKENTGVLVNTRDIAPLRPFHSLKATLINGQPFDFSKLHGKKVMIVNVASNCGFTGQYDELEKLYKSYGDELVILGFPANDFKEQEKGTDEEILQFCKVNFGVTFPLFQKHSVLKPNQGAVYKWLTDPLENGWNVQQPTWNFCKYIVDETGNLKAFFPSAVSPLSEELLSLVR